MKQSQIKGKLIVSSAVVAGCTIMALLLRSAAIDELDISTAAGNIVFAIGIILFTALYYGLSSSEKTENAKIVVQSRQKSS